MNPTAVPLKPRSALEQATVSKHQRLLHEMQNLVMAMKGQYQEDELPFRALNLAFESLRIAWYAAANDVEGCQKHLEHLDRAEFWLTSLLLPQYFEPAIPLPVFDWSEEEPPNPEPSEAYPPQFCDCGCTTEFGDPTGAACVGWREAA